MSKPKQPDTRRPALLAILFVALLATALTTSGCGKQMARMETNQVRLQAMIMANARQLATVSSQVHAGHTEVNQTLAQIDQKADGINAEVLTVQNKQTQLRETIVAGNKQINRKTAQLEANQAHLKDGVAQVGNIAQSTNVAVGAVAKDQATLHRMVQSNKQELADSLTAVAQNQQRTHTGIDQLQEADRSLASQITGVSQQQEAMQKYARDSNRQVVDHLTALGNEQTALHNSFQNNTQTLADKLAILEQHQFDVQSIIDRVANTTTKTAGDITTLTATQSAMRQTQGTHYENLTGQLAGVARDQGALQASLGTLDTKADRTTSQLTTLAAEQNTLHETLQANNASVSEELTSLSGNQQTLRGDLQQLNKHSEALAANLNTALTNQASMGTVLTDNSDAFATFAENQTTLRKHVSNLDGKADAMASHISSVATELGTVRDSVRNGNDTVVAHVTTLTEGQHNLKAGLSQLTEQTTQVAAGQTALGQAVQDHDQAARGQMTNIANDQQTIRERVDTIMATASQIGLNLVTASNRQSEFEQNVHTGLGDLASSQQTLQGSVDTLATGATQIGLDLIAVSEGQNQLKQAVNSGINNLATNDTQLAADLRTVGERQMALNETLASHDENVARQVTNLAQRQGQLQSGLDGVAATTTQLALDVITVDDHQAKLEQTAQADRAKFDTRLTHVVENQQQIQGGLDMLTATTTQVALDVLTLDDTQTRQSQSVQANHQEVVSKLTAAAQDQQQMQGGLDMLTATTTQVALDVLTLDDTQTRQSQSVQANHQEVVSKLTAAAQDQQQMQGSLDVITATTTQVGLDVIALDGKQDNVAQALQTNRQEFGPKLTALSDHQQQLQTELDTLTATTTQVALDVLSLDESQARQGQALEARQQGLASQVKTVTQGQQQMQSNLDIVTATTSQVALDVITLDDNQDKIEQAVQANRQELATKLAEIAQGQQQWLARYDAAEAQVATMTAGITALEQRVTNLQGTLQTSLQDLSTLLDAESQQRVQFQDSVRQDMQSVTGSIAQLREIQAGLAEHIQRVQDSTQSQTGDILSALEQLQQKTDADATNVDTELKSSRATPQEITLP